MHPTSVLLNFFYYQKIYGWKSNISLLIFFYFFIFINNFVSWKLKCALLFLGFFFPEKIERLFFRNLKLLHSCLFLIFCNIIFFLKKRNFQHHGYFCHIPFDGYIILENFLLVSPRLFH